MKFEWPLILLLAASFIYGIYVYPSLPDQVPSHWNIQGEVDGWSTPFWGAFGMPLLNLGMYIMFFLIPRIDPKKEKYAKFRGAYNAFRYALHLLLAGLFVVIMMAARGMEPDVDRLVPMGVAILFIIIGNYMGKIQKNYFFGIRTPWTLDNEEVWRKTHRMAGPLWVGGGLVSLIGAVFGGKTASVVFFSALAIMVVVPTVYSYFAFQRLKNQ
ncbi:MAG: hypothetical protein CVU89_01395 [Firmicutes bacterium HGW-Firmicutes-14]|nr:MAG: hypothetical protein CVU89_01395 [Firmicutes bacterium HGW-Firmicutes-14]